MEVMESKDFRKWGRDAADIQRHHAKELDQEAKRSLEVDVVRAKNLAKIEAATGLTFKVFAKGEPHVAAFVRVDNLETYMASHSLDNLDWAIYAAKHELKHIQTKDFMRLHDKPITVSEDQYDVLDDALKSLDVDMKHVDWVEGFTDMLTARENGEHSNSGYNDHEVPAAEKLDSLCLEKTGISLADAFNANNVPLFTARLKRLCEVLLLEESFDELAEQDVEVAGMRTEVKVRMDAYKPIVQTKDDAEKFVAKMVAECLALKQIRRYVRPDEKLSSVSTPAGMLS